MHQPDDDRPAVHNVTSDSAPEPSRQRFSRRHKRGVRIGLITAALLLTLGLAAVAVFYARESATRGDMALQGGINRQRDVRSLTLQLIDTARSLKDASGAERTEITRDLQTIVDARQGSMKQMMKEDPASFLSLAEPTGFKDILPAELAETTERRVELTGRLEIIHGEVIGEQKSDSDHNDGHDHSGPTVTAEYEYFIEEADGKKTQVYFTDKVEIRFANKKVRVTGVKLDTEAAADSTSLSLQAGETATSTAEPATTKKVAVVLLNFESNKTQPWTQDQIRTTVFTGASSSNAYFKEASFGKVGLAGIARPDGDIFGYYTVAYDTATCSHSTIASLGSSAASAAGVSLSSYTNVIYVFPYVSACTWGGKAQMNSRTSWINGYGTDAGLYSHELGHNFGAYHAASMSCTLNGVRVTMSDSCTFSEYGDPYDTMGSSYTRRHFNSAYKGRLQYFPSTTNTVTATSGTYKVTPIAAASTGIQALRIPRDFDINGVPTKYYYVDFRQPFGFDNYSTTSNVVQGASIRIGADYSKVDYTYLLDMTPGTTSFADSALLPGKTFFDEKRNIRITVNTVDASGVTVTINGSTEPVCVRANPTVKIDPVSQWADAGASLSYKVAVTNNDSAQCAPAAFTLAGTLPQGFTQSPLSPSVTVAPGATVTTDLTITSPAGQTSGSYGFTETATHGTDATLRASSTGTYNVYEQASVPPAVAITTPENNAVINGKATIRATSSSQLGIAKTEIYVDGTKKAESLGTSVSTTMNVRKSKTSKTYVLTAKAYDVRGGTSSHTIYVRTP